MIQYKYSIDFHKFFEGFQIIPATSMEETVLAIAKQGKCLVMDKVPGFVIFHVTDREGLPDENEIIQQCEILSEIIEASMIYFLSEKKGEIEN